MYSIFFILFNTVSYLKLNFKLKIDPKMCTFKNLEKFLKKRVATLYLCEFIYFNRISFIACMKANSMSCNFILMKQTYLYKF